ncbi:MAG: hypothetical protein WCC37_16440, partial [Candidatus Sulfotelmatobacter sp.]
VMNSVDQERAGTASGVNNAVARVAGVLAIAILGIVMVKAFSFRLNDGLTLLSLPTAVLQEIKANAIKLAGLPIPAGLAPSVRAAISKSIGEAFVFGFRVVMLICAGLSLASSAVAWMMIPRPNRK